MIVMLTTILTAQTNFEKGFQNGFKDGYCYQMHGCIAPTSPITPILRMGESSDNYKDGYNRGFVSGKNKKRANFKNKESNSNSEVTTSKYEPITDKSYYNSMANNLANRIYNTAKHYRKVIDNDLKARNDYQFRDDLNRAKAYLNKVFVQGVRLGDAESYLKTTKRLYKKAIRKYNKRIKKKAKQKDKEPQKKIKEFANRNIT